jgi:hypothetical protein
MKKTFITILILVMAVAAFAQDKAAANKDKEQAGMDMNAMMAAYEKMAAPGPEHAILAKMAGEWNSTSKMWMDPKQPPMETKGSQKGEMLLGGRYLQSTSKGEIMGKPMEGVCTMAFDKFRKKFLLTWIDNWGTSISSAEGTISADNKEITFLGKMDEPMSGEKDKPIKYVFTFVNDKTFTLKMYDKVGTPDEFVAMEDTNTKK